MAFISKCNRWRSRLRCEEIEASINTEKHRNPDGSYKDRVLDIDIMDVEGIIIRGHPGADNPHPHLNDRPFFLEPYNELRT